MPLCVWEVGEWFWDCQGHLLESLGPCCESRHDWLWVRRDYCLGLPSPDLASIIPIEAKYADAVAMSQAMSMSLEVFGQNILTCEAAARFWLQHSDRAVLPSLAGVLADIKIRDGSKMWGVGLSPHRTSMCGLICSGCGPFSVVWQ